MSVSLRFSRLSLWGTLASVALVAGLAAAGRGQTPAPASRAPASWIVFSKAGRQPLPTTQAGGREFVSLAELSRLFELEAREDPLTGSLVVSVQGKTIVLSSSQGLASIGGRVVTLSAPPQKTGDTWQLPIDFVDRALSLVYQPRLDVRPRSHIILVGDVRVPRVGVRLESLPNLSRVHIDIRPPTPHTVVQEPGRLVVRFEAEALDLELAPAGSPDIVMAIRQMPNVAALVIELGPRFATFRANAAPPDGGAQRLTLELLAAAPPVTATPGAPAPGTPAAPGAPAPGAPTTTAPAPAAPGMPGAPAPPPVLPVAPASAIRSIVIDPGHGGEAEGAKGPGGTLEKTVTLQVGRQLKSALEARLGVRVLLTREDDTTVELDARAAYANNNKADLFVSLHANASVGRAANGAEVFYLSLDGYSPEARRVAMREGAVLPSVTGGDRQIELILWEMAQVQHIEQSAAFASLIEQSLRSRVKMSARAIQQAPFRVLVGANMPAVLVELGFISNPDEEKLLRSPAHQRLLVDALVESIVRFREQLDAPRPTAAGIASGGAPAGPPQPERPREP